MKRKRWYSALTIIILNSTICKAQNLDLLKLNNWKIIASTNAIASEKFAAEEFRSLLEKSTGIKLEIIDKPTNKFKNIFIGYSNEMVQSNCGFSINDLGEEGLRINIKKNNIAIAGGRPRGTLYGVYEFFEKYFGVRFLAYDYTYIPNIKNVLSIPCELYTYKPSFEYRSSYYRENINHPEFSVKLKNNSFAKDEKLGGACNKQFVTHSLFWQCPTEKYGKEHPEYFAEVGGKRLLEAYGGGPQVDVSNSDVIKLVTDTVLKEIVKHPEYKNIGVVQNDNQYYCRCKNCEAINEKEGSPMAAHLKMVNAIADQVAKSYPGIDVGTLAYQYTRRPPKTIIPRDNVMIQLCSIECDLLHSYDQPGNKMNKPFADDLAGWGKICKNLWIWDYIVDYYVYGLPFPNLKSIGKNIKYYKDHNVKGVFMEANYSSEAGEMSDLKNYITSKCLWNPELNSWKLTEEFCNLYYKKAAKPILEYLTKLHDNIEEKKLKAKFNALPKDVGLDATFAEWIFDKFQDAIKLADDEEVKNRVERASLCAYVAVIEAARGELRYNNGKANYLSTEKYKKILSDFPALAKKHHMYYYSEEENPNIDEVEKYFNNELNIYKNGGRPAVQLKNQDWKLTILPEENGKCIELRNEKNNINLLSNDVTDLSAGFFTESFLNRKNNDTINFSAAINNNELMLHAILKDSTGYLRKITLGENADPSILLESTIKNQSSVEKTYQLKVDVNTNTGARERDFNIFKAFVKNNNKLVAFNNGLIGSHGPDEQLLVQAKNGGEISLLNTQKSSGFRIIYTPQMADALNASWTNSGLIFNLGFKTVSVTLKPGETYTLKYAIKSW